MPQNSIVFGALAIGFVVYITIKGRLPAYLALFYTRQAAPSNATETSSSFTAPQYGGVAAPTTTSPQGESLPTPTLELPALVNPYEPQGF